MKRTGCTPEIPDTSDDERKVQGEPEKRIPKPHILYTLMYIIYDVSVCFFLAHPVVLSIQ